MSMKGKKHAGALYRLDPDGSIHKMIDSVTTSNGIAWSLDATKLPGQAQAKKILKNFHKQEAFSKLNRVQKG